jgi:5-methylcytosine-specific restriction enzyme subunit McrC
VATEVIECEEFGTIQIGVNHLLVGGEVKIDSRTSGRGFINIAFNKGQVVFRADRHVGLIPINENFAVHVRPRTRISNIAHMLIKSGVVPIALPDYSRGYMPRFEIGEHVERIYYKSLIGGVERVVSRGLLKSYSRVENPPAWRGRLLLAETISRHIANGIRYRKEFEFNTLSVATPENIALKEALLHVGAWLKANEPRNTAIKDVNRLLAAMEIIPRWESRLDYLITEVGRRVSLLPGHYGYYRDPLWTAYLLLQSKLPDLASDGFISLDSLIIDISKVFEAYVRRILSDRAAARGWVIRDGNLRPAKFFIDEGTYEVRPDIVITQGNTSLAVLDMKYKPDLKEGDRYEVLSFMDVFGVTIGGFICPQKDNEISRYMGKTVGDKKLSLLRFNLSAQDIGAECDRLFDNVCRMVDEDYHYV